MMAGEALIVAPKPGETSRRSASSLQGGHLVPVISKRASNPLGPPRVRETQAIKCRMLPPSRSFQRLTPLLPPIPLRVLENQPPNQCGSPPTIKIRVTSLTHGQAQLILGNWNISLRSLPSSRPRQPRPLGRMPQRSNIIGRTFCHLPRLTCKQFEKLGLGELSPSQHPLKW